MIRHTFVFRIAPPVRVRPVFWEFFMSTSDLITLRDIATRLPPLVRKLPHVVRGLILANDTRPTKPMGLAWAFERAVRASPNPAGR